MSYSDYIKKDSTPFQKNFIGLLNDDISQKYYADELGVSPQNFYNWVSGKNIPDADKLTQIASFFNVSVDWLLGVSKPLSDFCEYTGLSERSVAALHIANSTGEIVSKVFNEMIEGGELWTICGLIGNVSDEIRDLYNELKTVELSVNKIKLSQVIRKDSSLEHEELEILTKRQKELSDEIEFEKWKIIKSTENMVSELLMSLSKKCDISDLGSADR